MNTMQIQLQLQQIQLQSGTCAVFLRVLCFCLPVFIPPTVTHSFMALSPEPNSPDPNSVLK
jgi:hypothetical protein